MEGLIKYWRQYLCSFAASLVLANINIIYVWTSPSIDYLKSSKTHIPINDQDATIIILLFMGLTIVFIPLGAYLSDLVGRKKTIIILTIPYCASLLLNYFSSNKYHLFISRTLCSLTGTLSSISAEYITEISDYKIRGKLLSMIPFSSTVAILFYFFIQDYFNFFQIQLILLAIPLAMILMFLVVPESPYFLMMMNREKEAEIALTRFGFDNVKKEINEINETIGCHNEEITFKIFFNTPGMRKAFFAGCFLLYCEQMTACTPIGSYAILIFEDFHMKFITPAKALVLFQIVSMFSLILSMIITDSVGKKPLYYLSLFGIGTCLAVFAIMTSNKSLLTESNLGWIPFSAYVIYQISYNPGVGMSLPIMSEFFPVEYKKFAFSIIGTISPIGSFLSTIIFQLLSENYGIHVSYAFYAIICYLNIVLFYKLIPETAKKHFLEIYQWFGIEIKKTSHQTELSLIENKESQF